jgi:cytochrome c556
MHWKQTRIIPLIALAVTMTAVAEPAPEDAAKYRQSVMKALAGHNGAISMIVRGKAGDAANLGDHVDAMQNLSGEVADLFAAGSDTEDDEALAAIWENADAFAEAVDGFETAVGQLSEALDGGDVEAIDSAHRAMSKTCKGCHEDFREKKED